ncbi:hypothetical protein [Stenotrophomonas sp.]|uniref:hypothetical protein n=1 Tax=Stenotrophomonas sp. TaxID=69392 RepID=UPI0028A77B21|nr:hypothetical protein [Stenotrophomonas sp.]
MRLTEATLMIDVGEMRMIAQFLLQCADEVDENPEWEHAHLQDYLKGRNELGADLVVFLGGKT